MEDHSLFSEQNIFRSFKRICILAECPMFCAFLTFARNMFFTSLPAVERGCMEGTGFMIGCMVGMSGTTPTDLTTMTCLCDKDRCNGLSANALICKNFFFVLSFSLVGSAKFLKGIFLRHDVFFVKKHKNLQLLLAWTLPSSQFTSSKQCQKVLLSDGWMGSQILYHFLQNFSSDSVLASGWRLQWLLRIRQRWNGCGHIQPTTVLPHGSCSEHFSSLYWYS